MDNRKINVGVGIPSILMIFISICLSIFGVLTFKTANSDITMSEKNAQRITEYYTAKSETENHIATITEMVNENPSAFDSSSSIEQVTILEENGQNFLLINVGAGADRVLETKVSVSDGKCTIESSKLISTYPWEEISDELDLWSGF